MVKKPEPRQTLRARVASKFTHEDEPEATKVTDANDPTVTGARTPKDAETQIGVPLEPTYSVGAGAAPELQKKLQATIEADRKALKKKQT